MNKKNKHIDEDIVLEEDLSEDSQIGQDYQKKIKLLKEKLELCQKEKEEYLSGWQRAQADFINYKKQNDSLFAQAKESATFSMIETLLPIVDSFEMALHGTFDESFKKWLTGFEYIYNQFRKIIEDLGVIEINPINKPFSPEEHEAIEEIQTEDESLDHTVAQVILKGYKTQNRIIRAASVKVFILKIDK